MGEVEPLPALVLVKADGSVITRDGCRFVREYGAMYFPWGPEECHRAQADKQHELERSQAAQLLREEELMQQQKAIGAGSVVNRLRGAPGGLSFQHVVEEHQVHVTQFCTLGAAEMLTTAG